MCMPWLMQMCDALFSYVTWLENEPFQTRECFITHMYVFHCTHVCVSLHTCMCFIAHMYVTHTSVKWNKWSHIHVFVSLHNVVWHILCHYIVHTLCNETNTCMCDYLLNTCMCDYLLNTCMCHYLLNTCMCHYLFHYVFHYTHVCRTYGYTHTNEIRDTHGKHANVSLHTCICFITHTYAAHMDKSCHTYEWDTWHTRKTRECFITNVSWHTSNASLHTCICHQLHQLYRCIPSLISQL